MSKARTLKVFCSADEQKLLAESNKVIERYSGFVVLEVDAPSARKLARKYPVEDITDHYLISIAGKAINTSRPRVTAVGKLRTHSAYSCSNRCRRTHGRAAACGYHIGSSAAVRSLGSTRMHTSVIMRLP